MPPLRSLHRLSALAIGVFLVVHMGNHLAGLAGQTEHMAVMAALRRIYRVPVVEAVLFALLLWQIGSGALLLVRRWRVLDGAVAVLQVTSGALLLVFLIIHIGAILAGRAAGVNTDFRFAAAGFHTGLWWLFFAPYYWLAVLALTTHIGCAVYWHLGAYSVRIRQGVLAGFVFAGTIAGGAIVLALAGVLYPVDISQGVR